MKADVVQAPASLLLDPELSATAKLVWMVWSLLTACGPVNISLLAARSGLSRVPVRQSLAQLASAGWLSTASLNRAVAIDRSPSDARATITGDLLQSVRIGVQARVLFGILQVLPVCRNRTGQFTYPQLSGMAPLSLNTARRAVHELVGWGWLKVTQEHRTAPIQFALSNPVVAASEAEVVRVRKRLEAAPLLGKALMHEYLSLLIGSLEYWDSSRMGFLLDPFTEEPMELDRYYSKLEVAFEFDDPREYDALARRSAGAAAKHLAQTYIKLGICLTRNIRVVTVRPADLTLPAMQELIGELLPLRDLQGQEPLITFLEKESEKYRVSAEACKLASV